MESTQVLDLDSSIIDSSARLHEDVVARIIIPKTDDCDGAEYALKNGQNKVGRDSSVCSICIQDVNVSRSHAVILCEGTRYFHIFDVGSANGTFIESRGTRYKLKPRVHYNICDGDKITFGSIVSKFTTDLSPPKVIDDSDSDTASESMLPSDDEMDDSIIGVPCGIKKRCPIISDSTEDESSIASNSSVEIPSSQKDKKTEEEISPFKTPNALPIRFSQHPSSQTSPVSSKPTTSKTTVEGKTSSSDSEKVEKSIHDMDIQNQDRSIYDLETQLPGDDLNDSIYEKETQNLNSSIYETATQKVCQITPDRSPQSQMKRDSPISNHKPRKLSENLYDLETQKVEDIYSKETQKVEEIYSKETQKVEEIYSKETQKIEEIYSKETQKVEEIYSKETQKIEEIYSKETQKVEDICSKETQKVENIFSEETQKLNLDKEPDNSNAKTGKSCQSIYNLETQKFTDNIYDKETQKPHFEEEPVSSNVKTGKFSKNIYNLETQKLTGDIYSKETQKICENVFESETQKIGGAVFDMETQKLYGTVSDKDNHKTIFDKETQKLDGSIFNQETQKPSDSVYEMETQKLTDVAFDKDQSTKKRNKPIFDEETQKLNQSIFNQETQKPSDIYDKETQKIGDAIFDKDTQLLSDPSHFKKKVKPNETSLRRENIDSKNTQKPQKTIANIDPFDTDDDFDDIEMEKAIDKHLSDIETSFIPSTPVSDTNISKRKSSIVLEKSSRKDSINSPNSVLDSSIKSIKNKLNKSSNSNNQSPSTSSLYSMELNSFNGGDDTDIDSLEKSVVNPTQSSKKLEIQDAISKKSENFDDLDDIATQKLPPKAAEAVQIKNDTLDNLSDLLTQQICENKNISSKSEDKRFQNLEAETAEKVISVSDSMLTQIIDQPFSSKKGFPFEKKSPLTVSALAELSMQIIDCDAWTPKKTIEFVKSSALDTENISILNEMLTQKINDRITDKIQNELSCSKIDEEIDEMMTQKLPSSKESKPINNLRNQRLMSLKEDESFNSLATQKLPSSSEDKSCDNLQTQKLHVIEDDEPIDSLMTQQLPRVSGRELSSDKTTNKFKNSNCNNSEMDLDNFMTQKLPNISGQEHTSDKTMNMSKQTKSMNMSKQSNYNNSEMDLDDLLTQRIETVEGIADIRKMERIKFPKCSTSTPKVAIKSKTILSSFSNSNIDEMLTQKIPCIEKSKDITSHDILSMEVCQSQPLAAGKIDETHDKLEISKSSCSSFTPFKRDLRKSLKCSKSRTRTDLDIISSGDETDDNSEKPLENVVKFSSLNVIKNSSGDETDDDFEKPSENVVKPSSLNIIKNLKEESSSLRPSSTDLEVEALCQKPSAQNTARKVSPVKELETESLNEECPESQSVLEDEEIPSSQTSTPDSESLLPEVNSPFFKSIANNDDLEKALKAEEATKLQPSNALKLNKDKDDSKSSGTVTPDDLAFENEKIPDHSDETKKFVENKSENQLGSRRDGNLSISEKSVPLVKKSEPKKNPQPVKGITEAQLKLRCSDLEEAKSSSFESESKKGTENVEKSLWRNEEPILKGNKICDSKLLSDKPSSIENNKPTQQDESCVKKSDSELELTSKTSVSNLKSLVPSEEIAENAKTLRTEVKQARSRSKTNSEAEESIPESIAGENNEGQIEEAISCPIRSRSTRSKDTSGKYQKMLKGIHVTESKPSAPTSSDGKKNTRKTISSESREETVTHPDEKTPEIETKSKSKTVSKIPKPKQSDDSEKSSQKNESRKLSSDQKIVESEHENIVVMKKNEVQSTSGRALGNISSKKNSQNLQNETAAVNKIQLSELPSNITTLKSNNPTIASPPKILPQMDENSGIESDSSDVYCKRIKVTHGRCKRPLAISSDSEEDSIRSESGRTSRSSRTAELKRKNKTEDSSIELQKQPTNSVDEKPKKAKITKDAEVPLTDQLIGEKLVAGIKTLRTPSKRRASQVSEDTKVEIGTNDNMCEATAFTPKKRAKLKEEPINLLSENPISLDSKSPETSESSSRRTSRRGKPSSQKETDKNFAEKEESVVPFSLDPKSPETENSSNKKTSRRRKPLSHSETDSNNAEKEDVKPPSKNPLSSDLESLKTEEGSNKRTSRRKKLLSQSESDCNFGESESQKEVSTPSRERRSARSGRSQDIAGTTDLSKASLPKPSSDSTQKISIPLKKRKIPESMKEDFDLPKASPSKSSVDSSKNIGLAKKTKEITEETVIDGKTNKSSSKSTIDSSKKTAVSRKSSKISEVPPNDKPIEETNNSKGRTSSQRRNVSSDPPVKVETSCDKKPLIGRRSKMEAPIPRLSSRSTSQSDNESVKSDSKEAIKSKVTSLKHKSRADTKERISVDASTSESEDAASISSRLSSPASSRGSRSRKQESSPLTKSSRISMRKVSPPAEKYHIMFTGLDEKILSKFENIVASLGGILEESPAACSVLVTDKVRRTIKFLSALAQGKPIVSVKWLETSNKANSFKDPFEFLLQDKQNEQNFSFKLSESLVKARNAPLLAGYSVLVTPSVKPEPSQMKAIIESAAGKFLSKQPASWNENCFIVSTLEDRNCWPKKKNIKDSPKIVSAEIILRGVLQQKLDFQAYLLK